MPLNGPLSGFPAGRSGAPSSARSAASARATGSGAKAGARTGSPRAGAALWIADSSICSCAATASASSFTSCPSSSISAVSGSVVAWLRSATAATSFSSAAMRRSSSETWRPMSAVPRERSAIWLPTSKRSRCRLVTELTITSAVSVAMATTDASMPVKPNDRKLTAPAHAAISTMQNAMKMALRRPMFDPWSVARIAVHAGRANCPRAARQAQESSLSDARSLGFSHKGRRFRPARQRLLDRLAPAAQRLAQALAVEPFDRLVERRALLLRLTDAGEPVLYDLRQQLEVARKAVARVALAGARTRARGARTEPPCQQDIAPAAHCFDQALL